MSSGMSSRATLNSRLRVLVARAFRAEKLYGTSVPGRADRRLSFPQLAEAAGELRAREWQKGYYQLRTMLNELLSVGAPQSAVEGVIAIRKQFRERTEEAAQFVEQATGELQEAAGRHEFSHLLKLTLELIRQKAIAQSSRAICDELGAVLKASGIPDVDRERRRSFEPSWLTASVTDGSGSGNSAAASAGQSRSAPVAAPPAEELADDVVDEEPIYAKAGHVVPLRRHSSFGKMKR